MKVDWSKEAADELLKRYGSEVPAWKLAYDKEGCGCALSGVPALWAADGPEEGDVLAAGGPLRVWYDPRHEIFFEDNLKVDYHAGRGSFGLAGDSQIYTTRLVLADKRTSAAGTGIRG